MNTIDRMAAVSLAAEPQDRKNDDKVNVGGLWVNKSNGKNSYGYDIANYVLERNGTVIWDRSDPVNGKGVFGNIYQYMAAEINAPTGTQRERMMASDEYERDTRSGMTTFCKWMDEQWGLAVYRLTSPESGNKVVLITVHPEFIDPQTGKTAADMQRTRDRKAIKGQAEAAFRRLGRAYGEITARKELQSAVNEAVTGLPSGRRDALGSDDV